MASFPATDTDLTEDCPSTGLGNDLSPAVKTELLSISSPQLLSIAFFRLFNMTVQGQVRVEKKRRFYRVTVNRGEAVFEVRIGTMRVARMACALKAVKRFAPGLVGEWLHRNRSERISESTHQK